MNKRGITLSRNALIFILLGVAIIVFMALGFSVGWDKILPFTSSPNNIDSVAQGCSIACSLKSPEDFCGKQREVILNRKLTTYGSCHALSLKNPILGIEKCGGLCPETTASCTVEGQKDENCDGYPEIT